MLPCRGCAYKHEVPGGAHIRCAYDWTKRPKDVTPPPRPADRVLQWFIFPLNYDPVWGPDTCGARAETVDKAMERELSPLEEMLSLMGRRAF